MKRKILIIGTIVIILTTISFTVFKFYNKNNEENKIVDELDKEYKRITKLLKSSSQFSKSNISVNHENRTLVIDNKYEILISESLMQLEVEYDSDKDKYCEIIEAIEQGIGATKSSIETCKSVLNGTLQSNEIIGSNNESHWLLSVRTDIPGKFTDEVFTRKLGEKFNFGEENSFNILNNDYTLSNVSSYYDNENKTSNICFKIFNEKMTPKEFNILLYDSQENILYEQKYNYKGGEQLEVYVGENNPAEYFCIKWESDNIVKSFTIK